VELKFVLDNNGDEIETEEELRSVCSAGCQLMCLHPGEQWITARQITVVLTYYVVHFRVHIAQV
jgi:hypothetical protein